jgi:hypothetical protein
MFSSVDHFFRSANLLSMNFRSTSSSHSISPCSLTGSTCSIYLTCPIRISFRRCRDVVSATSGASVTRFGVISQFGRFFYVGRNFYTAKYRPKISAAYFNRPKFVLNRGHIFLVIIITIFFAKFLRHKFSRARFWAIFWAEASGHTGLCRDAVLRCPTVVFFSFQRLTRRRCSRIATPTQGCQIYLDTTYQKG